VHVGLGLYSGAARFQFWPEHRIFWDFPWFSPNLPGKCNDYSCLRSLLCSSNHFCLNLPSYSSKLYSLAIEIVVKQTTKCRSLSLECLRDAIKRKSPLVDVVLKLLAFFLSSPYIMRHFYSRQELWSQLRQPFLGIGSVNTPVATQQIRNMQQWSNLEEVFSTLSVR
jgi:hypothetical protein